jgi:hypothetical protein
MNDVTRTILVNSNNELVEKMSDDDDDEHSQITYVNGKMVFTDELDKAIMKNFKVCGAKKLIKEDLEESEFDDVRYNVNVPGVE